MKSPKKIIERKTIKSLVKPRQENEASLLDLQTLCTGNGGTCYRRNRSIESEDDILF